MELSALKWKNYIIIYLQIMKLHQITVIAFKVVLLAAHKHRDEEEEEEEVLHAVVELI